SATAAEVIARDRFSGALELLLCTSLTIAEVARGQFLTLRRVIFGPAIATVIVSVLVFGAGWGNETAAADKFSWIFALIGANVWFAVHLFSGFWTGLWMACVARLQTGAAGAAALRLLILPLVMFFLLVTATAVFRLRMMDAFAPTFL